MLSIQERAGAICDYHHSDGFDADCGYCASNLSTLRTLLLDLQREIEGLKDWDDMIAKTDVLALIAGLLEAK